MAQVAVCRKNLISPIRLKQRRNRQAPTSLWLVASGRGNAELQQQECDRSRWQDHVIGSVAHEGHKEQAVEAGAAIPAFVGISGIVDPALAVY